MKKVAFTLIVAVIPALIWSQESVDVDAKYAKEIRNLANNRIVERAFQSIYALEPFTSEQHIELTEISALAL